MIIVFCIALNVILVSGSSLSDKVHQTPAHVFNEPKETAKIHCSHSIDSYNRILWYKQWNRQLQFLGYMVATSEGNPEAGLGVKIEGGANKDQNCTLTIEELSLNSSVVYFCAASRDRGHNEPAYFGKGTKLTVLEKDRDITPPTVKVLPPSTKECRNQKDGPRKKTIVCVASGFYPDHVSVKWKIDGIKATSGVATDNAALQEGRYYRITSRLKVSGEDWFTLYKNFTCIVEFFDGTATIPYEDTVLGVEGEEGGMTRENYFKISQTAKLSYALLIIKSSLYGAFVAFLVWKLQRSTGKRNN